VAIIQHSLAAILLALPRHRWQSAPMASLSSYPDSRALFSVAIGARSTGVYQMDNLYKAIAMLDSNPRLRARLDVLNHTKTPPATLRDIVDAIAARRGVTLYRESV